MVNILAIYPKQTGSASRTTCFYLPEWHLCQYMALLVWVHGKFLFRLHNRWSTLRIKAAFDPADMMRELQLLLSCVASLGFGYSLIGQPYIVTNLALGQMDDS